MGGSLPVVGGARLAEGIAEDMHGGEGGCTVHGVVVAVGIAASRCAGLLGPRRVQSLPAVRADERCKHEPSKPTLYPYSLWRLEPIRLFLTSGKADLLLKVNDPPALEGARSTPFVHPSSAAYGLGWWAGCRGWIDWELARWSSLLKRSSPAAITKSGLVRSSPPPPPPRRRPPPPLPPPPPKKGPPATPVVAKVVAKAPAPGPAPRRTPSPPRKH